MRPKYTKKQILLKFKEGKPQSNLRKFIINNNLLGDYKCSNCNLESWLDKDISLELDHIDGINTNNKLTNLRWLCPNCHSQTSTFRKKSRNPMNKKFKTDDEIINIINLNKDKSISQILKLLELTNTGGNYKRIYNICKTKLLDIPIKENKAKTKISSIEEKIQNKITKLENRISLIKNSNINFDKKGWNRKVAVLIGISPQAIKPWMLREMPDFYKKCWMHRDNI